MAFSSSEDAADIYFMGPSSLKTPLAGHRMFGWEEVKTWSSILAPNVEGRGAFIKLTIVAHTCDNQCGS